MLTRVSRVGNIERLQNYIFKRYSAVMPATLALLISQYQSTAFTNNLHRLLGVLLGKAGEGLSGETLQLRYSELLGLEMWRADFFGSLINHPAVCSYNQQVTWGYTVFGPPYIFGTCKCDGRLMRWMTIRPSLILDLTFYIWSIIIAQLRGE
eukprot:Skav221624  [mRNA]  locus=scaffold3212:36413:39598:- [translate_table: standard]